MAWSFGLPSAPVVKGFYALVGQTVASRFGFKLGTNSDKSIAESTNAFPFSQELQY